MGALLGSWVSGAIAALFSDPSETSLAGDGEAVNGCITFSSLLAGARSFIYRKITLDAKKGMIGK